MTKLRSGTVVPKTPLHKSKKVAASPASPQSRITAFFAVRKRNHGEGDVDVLGKRFKRDVSFVEEPDHSPTDQRTPFKSLQIVDLVTPVKTPHHNMQLSMGKENISEDAMTPHRPNIPLPLRPGKSTLICRRLARTAASTTSMQMEPKRGLGKFGKLPLTVFFEFIAATKPLSNRTWMVAARHYLTTYDATRRLVAESKDVKGHERLMVFAQFGRLMKAVTFTESTAERVDFAIKFYTRTRLYADNENGWGLFFNALSSLWEFSECVKLMGAVLHAEEKRLATELDEVVTSEQGKKPELELKVRRWLRALFVDHAGEEAAFWMSVLLKMRSEMAEKARLLMVLFAPVEADDETNEPVIAWRSLCDVAVTSVADAELRLGSIAHALTLLYATPDKQRESWSWDQVSLFNLIEEVTTFPEPWSFDNFVGLLLQRPRLIPVSLVSRMTNSYEEEAGQMFSSMKTLLYRWNLDVSETLREPMRATMEGLKKTEHRRKFYESVLSAHNAHLVEATANVFRHLPATAAHMATQVLEEIHSHASVANLLFDVCSPI